MSRSINKEIEICQMVSPRFSFWQFPRVALPSLYSNHCSSPLKLHGALSTTEYLSVPAAWGQLAELCEPLVFCCVPCSETNFLQQGSLFRWRWYTVHEADQVSIINRRLKQLYGTLKPPLLPALTYGPGLQAALDHLNYCNNQPPPAGAHYHNTRCRYKEHWQSCPEKSTPRETRHTWNIFFRFTLFN